MPTYCAGWAGARAELTPITLRRAHRLVRQLDKERDMPAEKIGLFLSEWDRLVARKAEQLAGWDQSDVLRRLRERAAAGSPGPFRAASSRARRTVGSAGQG
jgi:hypothetical protein